MINLQKIKETMRKILAVDKLLHFSFSAVIVFSIGILFGIIPGLIAGIAVGFLKESYNKYIKKLVWDWNDIYADSVGITYAIIILL